LIKKAKFSGKIEGPKKLLESTGRKIWRPPWGLLKKGPTRNDKVKSLYYQYEEYEARNRWICRNCAPWRGQHYHAANLGHEACPPSKGSGITSGQRRANEELRRDLQQVGKRATDERAPFVPLRARPMPFSRAIMNTALPTTSLGPKVSFTGVEDPEAHLTAFHTQMMLTRGSGVVYCKMLMSTLSGAALEWFVSLPDRHITTFHQFATLFREQYLVNRPPPGFPMMFSTSNSNRRSP